MRESTAREDAARRVDDFGAPEFGNDLPLGFHHDKGFTFA
jgi:hypothetical protein